MTIKDNIEEINNKILNACYRAGRNINDIELLAVTKTINVEKIKEALEFGIKTIGENKVQEIVNKYPMIHDNIKWHMIGHLQTNKVKYIVDKVDMIQSIDSIKLVEEIDKKCKNASKEIDILVEINISGEKNKYGIDPFDTIDFIKKIKDYSNVHVKGLMTVMPLLNNKEELRPYFKKMKTIFENIKNERLNNVEMQYLSMGMTDDFEIAIEEGANIVRVGTGIFGKREYK